MMSKYKRLFELAVFIVGTAIGGGALALPFCVATQGVLYGLCVLVVSALFSVFSALFVLEAVLLNNREGHLFSIFKLYFGYFGQFLASGIYIFICLASLVAYISGISDVLCVCFGANRAVACSLVSLFHCSLLTLKTAKVSRFNAVVVNAMILSLCFVTAALVPNFSLKNFHFVRPDSLFSSFPVFMAAFSYQMVVPSLVNGDDFGDKHFFHKVIALGVGITSVMYMLWIVLVFGTFSIDGPGGILSAFNQSIPVLNNTVFGVRSDMINFIVGLFSVLAMSSSFIGVGVGCIDFMLDAVGFNENGRFLMAFLVVVPCMFISIFFDKLFLRALSLSGGIGDGVIHGLMPSAIMFYLFCNRHRFAFNNKSIYMFGIVLVVFVSVAGLCVEFGSYFR